jgi:hypothetical protein
VAELKTKLNEKSVTDFLDSVTDPKQRQDSQLILDLMQQITQAEPKMWGEAIVGFGSYHYKYASGREGDWFLTGFSPRKQNLTIYLMSGFEPFGDLLGQLGKFKTGKGCLYLKKIEDVNWDVLKKLIQASVTSLSRN